MKKAKMILSGLVVLTIVGSSLAFTSFGHKNIFKCDTAQGKCVFAGANYSTVQPTPTTDPEIINFTPYQGSLNQRCTGANPPCTQFIGDVYIND
jgi:hypothetical protein